MDDESDDDDDDNRDELTSEWGGDWRGWHNESELIPEMGWCISEWAIYDFQWGGRERL